MKLPGSGHDLSKCQIVGKIMPRLKYECIVDRHGNKYDDVDVTINKQRQIGYPNERRAYQNQDTTR